jgi:signal transduction histidine kinase
MYPEETRIYLALLTEAVSFATFTVVFMVSIRRYRRRRADAFLSLAEQEAARTEEEKARVAADLHDGLGAMVGALRLQVSALTAQSAKDRGRVEKIKEYTDDITAQIRELSGRMVPRLLEEKGPAAAIADHLGILASGGTLKVSCTCSIPDGALSPQNALHLYRIVQEIAGNTVRHSGASRLACRIAPAGRVLRVEISDDGRGFRKEEVARPGRGGLGLKNIMTRALLLHAKVWLETDEARGTAYVLEIPI